MQAKDEMEQKCKYDSSESCISRRRLDVSPLDDYIKGT